MFDRLGWPDWSMKIVVAMVVLGFPVTVALSWVFDISPSGIRRTDPTQLPGGRRNFISWIVDVGVGVMFFATLVMLMLHGVGA